MKHGSLPFFHHVQLGYQKVPKIPILDKIYYALNHF
jgi:hypothetical protein